jgi:hypothetical protein
MAYLLKKTIILTEFLTNICAYAIPAGCSLTSAEAAQLCKATKLKTN